MLILLSLILNIQTVLAASYPKAPDQRLTPGSLCTTPDRYRYPEQIPYCERNVNSFMKEHIFLLYRTELGYSLSGDRSNYKVDHYIPLCMGGSNNQDNLWPQHVNVGKLTDSIESMGCEIMGKGKLSQSEAIELVKQAKNDPKAAIEVLKYLRKLRK